MPQRLTQLAGEGQVIGIPLSLTAELIENDITTDPASMSEGVLTWHVSNAGDDDHEFLILQTDDTAADVIALGVEDDVADLSDYTVVGSSGVLSADDEMVVFADMPEGHYVIVSNQVNDVFLGMAIDFDVSALVDEADYPRQVGAVGRVVRRARLARGVKEVKTPTKTWRIFE